MRSVRIGCGLGFYGDSWRPARATLERGDVQYLCCDHLSELTLAILAKDRSKDASLGYARDVIPMFKELLPLGLPRGIRFIVNAGGLNPWAAKAALINMGVTAPIAVVTGDDVFANPGVAAAEGHVERHTLGDRLLFANAYLGALPIVEALSRGAQVVVTGRVADAALFLAPLIHEFGWTDYDRLAQGIVVGHLLECSGQVTGGNYGGDWRAIPNLATIGYPIAEVNADGTAIITKAPGTGGRVNFDTVREQLLYEVHDPFAYMTPDVTVDLSHVQLEDLGDDRVRVTGARGFAPPGTLKVVGGYRAGWAASCLLGYAWPDALPKAQTAAQILRKWLDDAEIPVLEIREEYPGINALHGPLAPMPSTELNEAYLRFSIRTEQKTHAEQFSRLVPALGLSGPPFLGAYGGPVPPRELLGYWEGRIARNAICAEVSM